jgi:NAD+ diphosphatase
MTEQLPLTAVPLPLTAAPLPLTAVAFDRAAHHRSDRGWLAQAWSRARVIPISADGTAAADRDPDGTPHVRYRAAADLAGDTPRRFLGTVDDQPYFAVTVEPDGEQWAGLRELGVRVDDLAAGLLTAAIALELWHQRHTHCPRCGTPTEEAQAGWTRRCPRDDSEHFPRTDPAVIMMIHDGADHALLGRGHQWGPGRFSTLAGFVEPGESLEAAVAREVFEEVGVRVQDLVYVASQPWPFPASLMLGFSGRLAGPKQVTLDPVEMAEAGWFHRDEIRRAVSWVDSGTEPDPAAALQSVAPRLSITRYLIDRWLAGGN